MNPFINNFFEIFKSPYKNNKSALKKLSQDKNIQPISKILIKSENNPIICPNHQNGWEAWQTFNPGVILLDNKVHFLYRALGPDGISRLGYAAATDGFHIDERLPYPVYEHFTKSGTFNYSSWASGGGFGGVEDPRLVRVGNEDTIYMTYTACDSGLRVGVSSIKINNFLNKEWDWSDPVFLSNPGEVHKNWVIFPEKINGRYAILHNICHGIKIDYVDSLMVKTPMNVKSPDPHSNQILRENCWDAYVRGVGATPLKTKYGWLIFYHAMNANDFSKYKIGAMILDLNEPTKILYRSNGPVLEPTDYHDFNGFKPGIVYTTGAVVKDGQLLLYYGAADSYISVAYANYEKFLNLLIHKEKVNLLTKILKFAKIRH